MAFNTYSANVQEKMYGIIRDYGEARLAFWDLLDQLEALEESKCKFICQYDLGVNSTCQSLIRYFGEPSRCNEDDIEDDEDLEEEDEEWF